MPRRPRAPSASPPSTSFRVRLRKVRDKIGVTQAELAERLHSLGRNIDRANIAKYERGLRKVTLDDLFTVAYALNVSPVTLLMPADEDEYVEVAPGIAHSPSHVREWLRGQVPLNGTQSRPFYETMSDEEFAAYNVDGFRRLVDAVTGFIRAAGKDNREAMKTQLGIIRFEAAVALQELGEEMGVVRHEHQEAH